MTDEARAPMPDGVDLERAITEAKAGQLGAQQFADVLRGATLMLALTDREDAGETDAVRPFVVEMDDDACGVAFTSPAQWDTFRAQGAFMLVTGGDLIRTWPEGLGLLINPGSEPSMMLTAAQLQGLLGDGGGNQTVPAGTAVRIGRPERPVPSEAVDLLRHAVHADPAVRAVYPLSVAQGDAAPELVFGVEPATPGERPAESFAATMQRADARFGSVAFMDLNGSLLASARKHAPAIT